MILKDVLREKHITQRELADRLHVSQASISNIVTGATEPSESTGRAIANILGMSYEELFGSADEWKYWDKNFACPRCGSRAVAEFLQHNDGSCRLKCGYCGLDTGEQRSREVAMRLFASYRPAAAEVAAETKRVRVMSVDELLDSSAYDSDDVRPVWFENRGLFCCPALVVAGAAERERECVRMEWHDSFGLKTFELRHYNTYWRCWTGKPTDAQAEETAWQ